MKIFAAVLVLSALVSCTPGRWRRDYTALGTPAEKMRSREIPRVLFIGNSFTMGVPEAFREAAAARGKRVETGSVARDRWTLMRHLRSRETREMMRENWDVIVFQERSDRPAKWWERNWFMIPALGALAEEAADRGALPVLYQTWGYGRHAGRLGGRVAAGCREAAESLGGIAVVPVGDAWEREILAGRAGLLFRADAKHPASYGNAVTANAFCDEFWGARSAQ